MADNITSSANSSHTNGCASVKCFFTNTEIWAVVASLSITFFASLVGNILVCFLIVKNRHLRNVTNYSVMNLSIADLLITVFCIPVVTVDLYITDEWIFGKASCKLVSFVQNVALSAAILNLTVISVEKFLMVWFPFFLRDKAKYVKWFLFATWIIGVLHASIIVNYRQIRVFAGKSYCMDNWPDMQIRRRYLIAQSIIFFFIPMFFILVLHILTITRIRVLSLPTSSREETSCLNYRRQNFKKSPSLNRKNLTRKRKAMNMLVLIFIAFALCLSPKHVFQLWIQNVDLRNVSTRTVNIAYVIVVWLLFFSCACHPIIYGLAGNKYRTAVRNSFSWRWGQDSSYRSGLKRQPAGAKRKQTAIEMI